jgi:hypothetical protein
MLLPGGMFEKKVYIHGRFLDGQIDLQNEDDSVVSYCPFYRWQFTH